MKEEVKLIYFYQLGAVGFRSGDYMYNSDYYETISKAAGNTDGLKHREITPQLMSRIMLNWLCERCSI